MIGTKLESLFEIQMFKIHTHDVHLTHSSIGYAFFAKTVLSCFEAARVILGKWPTLSQAVNYLRLLGKSG